jgi:hypothetical protein
MDYDTWKTTDPNADYTEECADCGEPCTEEFRTPTWKRGDIGDPVCKHCHESYDPRIP